MKAQSAVFFMKHPSLIISVLTLTSSLAMAQTYPPAGSGLAGSGLAPAPGAIQQPYYRQPGSAYVPPGTQTRAPQQTRPVAQPPATQGYKPGFGTPPNRTAANYKPPTIKGNSATKPKTVATKTSNSKPVNLESKVARLEKNDAHQDMRLGYLERGSGSQTIEADGGYMPTDGKLHIVRPGDTLWRIADKYNTSINAIRAANHFSGESISVGQTLMIPGYSSAPSASSLGAVHIVRPGDTFSEIALMHGVSQDSLARANPSAYPTRLLVGEKLTIPGKRASFVTGYPVVTGSTTVSTSKTHIVKKGQSLGAIAKSYGISTAKLATVNKLKNANVIEPGQRLIIPGIRQTKSPNSVPDYPPADQDTTPLPGAALVVSPPPTSTPEPAEQPISKPTPPASTNSRGIVAYRLERGDDINTVSALFNTSPDKIRELNKLPADRKLKEGDEVVVPSLGAVSLN